MTYTIHTEHQANAIGECYAITLSVDKHSPFLVDWNAYKVSEANYPIVQFVHNKAGYTTKASALRAVRKYVRQLAQ